MSTYYRRNYRRYRFRRYKQISYPRNFLNTKITRSFRVGLTGEHGIYKFFLDSGVAINGLDYVLDMSYVALSTAIWGTYQRIFTYFRLRGISFDFVPDARNTVAYNDNDEAQIPWSGTIVVGLLEDRGLLTITNNLNNLTLDQMLSNYRAINESNKCCVPDPQRSSRRYFSLRGTSWSIFPRREELNDDQSIPSAQALPYSICVGQNHFGNDANAIFPWWTMRVSLYIQVKNLIL